MYRICLAQGGGGTSGASQVKSQANADAVAGGDPHDAIELGKNGNPDLIEGPRSPAQNVEDEDVEKWLDSEAPKSGGRTVFDATTGKGIEYGVVKPTDGPMGDTQIGNAKSVKLTGYGEGNNEFAAHTRPPSGGADFSNMDLAAARRLTAPLYLAPAAGGLWVLDPIANSVMYVPPPRAYVPGTTALPDIPIR